MIDGEDKELIRKLILDTGAEAVGFAKADPVDAEVMRRYSAWIEEGKHAGMDYLRRHLPLKSHPGHVLEGVTTVICTAFSYAPARFRPSHMPMIACYAYGDDYHDVLRQRLNGVVEHLRVSLGGEWRVCIDSAPLNERYWALQSGIGAEGENGSVIVEKSGGYNFLAEILTSVPVAPDTPSRRHCIGCGTCRRACPQNALLEDGTIDARRCLNYLTIEHRGEWTGEEACAMSTGTARRTLYGCDICLRVCPHNRDAEPTLLNEFQPRQAIMDLDAAGIMTMTQQEFSTIFKGSPIKRAKLDGLRRNALNILQPHE